MTDSNRQPHEERVLIVLKPDAIQRSLIGEIIGRIERVGLKITAMKMVVPTEEQLIKHYNKDDAWFLKKGTNIVEELKAQGRPVEKEAIEYGKDIINMMVSYMTVAPCVAFIAQGNQAVAVALKLTGSTEPKSSDVGTIRGDYTIDSYGHASFENRGVRNLVHCSDSVGEAEREIKLWFDESEILKYVTAEERIMYDINFDGKKD